MSKRKKKNKYTKYIISAILIILLLVSILVDRKTSIIENFLKTIIYPVNKLEVSTSSDEDQTNSIDNLKSENEELKEDIEELKKELELNKTMTEYSVVNATVISRNKDYWFNTLNIDKGSKQGIKKGNAVVTYDGLIGKISKVYKYSSEIKLITTEDVNFKVSVNIKIDDKDHYGILNGYDKKNNLLKITGIDKDVKIKEDAKVKTSGLSNTYPSGLYIGKVKKIQNDSYNLSQIIYVKTKQNFDKIHYVTVIKEKK